MTKKQTNAAFLTIDIQIRFRGEVYELRLTNILKWLSALIIIGANLYHRFRGADP